MNINMKYLTTFEQREAVAGPGFLERGGAPVRIRRRQFGYGAPGQMAQPSVEGNFKKMA